MSTKLKLAPYTLAGEVALSALAAQTVTPASRAQAPYPPGNVKFNNYPFAQVVAGDLVISWNHRYRLGPYIVAQDASDVLGGPEGTYTITITINGVVKQTIASITGNSYTYSLAQRLIDDPDFSHPTVVTITPVNANGLAGTPRTLSCIMNYLWTGLPVAPSGWTPPPPAPPGSAGTLRPTIIGAGGADPGEIGGMTAGLANTLGNVIDGDTSSYTEFYCSPLLRVPPQTTGGAAGFVASRAPNGPAVATSITANLDMEILENDANGANNGGLACGVLPVLGANVGFTFLRWQLLNVAIGAGPAARQVYSAAIPVAYTLGILQMQFFFGALLLGDSTTGGLKVRIYDINFVVT